MKHLRSTFERNGYAKRVIDPIMRKNQPIHGSTLSGGRNEKEVEKNKNEEEEEERRWTPILCLPYVKGLSESIERERKVIGSEKLKLGFHPNRTMRQKLVWVKNRIPLRKRKGWCMKFNATIVNKYMWVKQAAL